MIGAPRMKDTIMISMRLNRKVKEDAERIFSSLGLTLTAGVNLYLSQVVMQQRIPFPLVLSDDVKAELAAEKEAEYKLSTVV